MSTRSRIGFLHTDGTTETIYCHNDGYPENQMKILTENYDTAEKVRELLALGDISELGERIAPDEGEEHGFDYERRAEGVTVAYHRDRGEPLSPAVRHENIVALKDYDWQIEWFYLFDMGSGNWLLPIEG